MTATPDEFLAAIRAATAETANLATRVGVLSEKLQEVHSAVLGRPDGVAYDVDRLKTQLENLQSSLDELKNNTSTDVNSDMIKDVTALQTDMANIKDERKMSKGWVVAILISAAGGAGGLILSLIQLLAKKKGG